MSFSIDFILDGKNILYRINFKYKKENESEKIEVVYVSEYIDKDDVFNVAPYLDLIYELEEA